MSKNIIAVFGGRSTEHDISVITAIEALYAIPSKYNVLPIYMRAGKFYGGDGLYTLKNYTPFVPQNHVELGFFNGTVYKLSKHGKLKQYFKPDCALLLNHGGEGENGALQGFFDIQGVPYTSSGVFGSAIAMDKFTAKCRLRSVGVPVTEGVIVRADCAERDIAEAEKSGYPLFVKPNSQGSSIGIGAAKDGAELRDKLAIAFEYDAEALVERCLTDFVELNVACRRVGGVLRVSAPERPISSRDALTFDDKYMVGAKGGVGMSGGRREFPARVSDEILVELDRLTRLIYDELKLSGVVRIDYMLAEGRIYFNEVNSIPGSLAHYLYPEIGYGEFLSETIEECMSFGAKKEPTFLSSVLTQGISKSGAPI